MEDPQNPYASPHSDASPPAEGLGDILSAPGLQRTATGLGFVYYGIMIMLVMILVMMGVMVFLLSAQDPRQGMATLQSPLFIIAGVGAILGTLLMFIGQVLCLAVPPQSGARGLIVGTVILQVIGFVISLAWGYVGNMPAEKGKPGNLLGMIAAILFILFLRKVSKYIERPDLAARAGNILGIILAIAGLLVMGGILMVARAAFAPLFMAVGGLLMLVVFVMYVNLLNALRKALRGW